jgi:poly(3-hydroxybutyrate) depolymerase
MATSYLAMINSPYQPKTMTLMGGPIDARINPGQVNTFASEHAIDWYQNNLITTIPGYYPGAGRSVCPGFLLLSGFMSLNAPRHNDALFDFFNHLVQGDLDSAKHHRLFYNEYRSVMDIPGEYFIQSVEKVFHYFDLPLGRMTFRGHPIHPSFIKETALLTIEGGKDDISCPGQTYAAHDLCSSLPAHMKKHYLQKDVGHYGIFNGKRWRTHIQPQIENLIAHFS